ncbi:MAG: tryptophan 7-halogenase [Pseudolabrys sp.]
MPNGKHHRVLIIGGGTAGITVAAILRRRARDLDIAVVEPEQEHYYQPSFTLVGAGVYPLAKTHRPEASVIPPGVIWIRDAAKSFGPLAQWRYAHLRISGGLHRREARLGQGHRTR